MNRHPISNLRRLSLSGLILAVFMMIGILSSVTFAADKNSSDKKAAAPKAEAAPTPAPNSDKLDVSDLEKKYWSAKDTDFSVVQNRSYTKANRWAVSLMYGPILNDNYSDGLSLAVSGQYFFSERFGAEVTFIQNSSKDNNGVSTLSSTQGAKPDFDRSLGYYGVNFNWIPFYAKMSVMNSKILYFDMAFSPGFGITSYEQEYLFGNYKKSSPTASFNITQHFFLNNNFAIRAEVQNRWFNQDVISFRYNNALRTDFQHDSSFLLGLDYFF